MLPPPSLGGAADHRSKSGRALSEEGRVLYYSLWKVLLAFYFDFRRSGDQPVRRFSFLQVLLQGLKNFH